VKFKHLLWLFLLLVLPVWIYFAVPQKMFIERGETLGYMGNTGNAVNTATHLYYSIATPLPYLWNYRKDNPYAWERMFFINPDKLLKNSVFYE